jgi:hypothetical protein
MISGRPVVFRKTAGTMLRYKRQFGRELYPDLVKAFELVPLMEKLDQKNTEKMTDVEKVELASVFLSTNFEWMYDIAFIMAQQADPTITDELTWLDSFDDFDPWAVFAQLMDLIRNEQEIAPKNA